jgi:hypothetical protein
MKGDKEMAEKERPKVLGNKSDGYKYHYTSLSDIVIAGYDLPPMRIATLTNNNGDPVIVDGRPVEYIEAERNFGYVEENGEIVTKSEWIRGARVVIPKQAEGAKDNKTMNDAQLYGSAITYARRYTAMLFFGIACDDDDKLETKTQAEAQAQELANMKDDLLELYKKVGGKAFETYLKERGGLSFETYPKIKAELMKRITDKAEKEKET